MTACGSSKSEKEEKQDSVAGTVESSESVVEAEPTQIMDMVIPAEYKIEIRNRMKDNYFMVINDDFDIAIYIVEFFLAYLQQM